MKTLVLTCFLATCSLSAFAQALPHRPLPSDMHTGTFPADVPPIAQHARTVDPLQLMHEAEQLQLLSSSVRGEIQAVNQGVLPKDLSDHLKEIEKLAKHLQSELKR